MSTKFKQLFALTGQGDHNAEVIAISGLAEARPENWLCNSEPWLKSMMNRHPGKVQIWSYEWASPGPKGSLLDCLSAEGTSFASALCALCALCERNVVHRRPLLIVCHGLGGVIFKKALCLLKNEYLYGSVFRRIHGIVFLSTPHLTNPELWNKDLFHLLCRLKTVKRSSGATPALKSEVDRDMFMHICDACDFGVFPGQVISGYSVKAGMTGPRSFFSKLRKPKAPIRVAKIYGVVSAPLEKRIGMNSTHENACHIEQPSEIYTAISEAFDSLVLQGPQLSMQKFKLPERDGLEDGTFRSHSSRIATSVSIALGKVPHTDRSLTPAVQEASAIGVSTGPGNKSPVLPYFPQKLPPRHLRFFGREDTFDLIDAALIPDGAALPAGNQLRTFALCGVGGVGKTETAISYIISRRDKFDAIFWVAADNHNILYEEYATICTDLQIVNPQDTQDLMAVCETTRWWLSNPVKSFDKPLSGLNEARWLLVFDNVDDFGVLEDLWPSTGIGSVLLTSRNAVAKAQVFTATNGCDLEPFNEVESVRFLNSLTQHPLDEIDTTAIALVRLTGGLPLLINQMAGAMRNSNFTRLRMLDMLKAAGLSALYAGRIENASQEDQERRVFMLSSKLGLEPLKADSRSLLEIISFLDPDKIPKSMFEDHIAVAGLSGLATEKAGFDSSIKQLIHSSLVLQDTGAKDLRLHRIVQHVVREAMSVHRRTEALTATVKLVAESWVDLLARWEIQRYPECAVVFPSVVRVLSHYQEMSKTGQVPVSEIAARLFNDSGWYWLERGFPEESVVFFKAAQMVAEGLLMRGPNAEAEYHLRETHTNISTAAAETNKPQLCLEHSLKYLEFALNKTSFTGDLVVDFELGLTYNEAGVAQSMNGQFRAALESFRKCAEIWQSLDYYDETMMGLPFGNIGLVHWIEGRYTEALDTLHEMRRIYSRNYGVDDIKTFKTGKVLYALGNVYLSVGDLTHAFEYHGRALNQWLATLGKGHHRIGDVTHKLCMDFMAIKDYRIAQSYLDQALKIFASRTYHRNELARSTYKQGQLHAANGQHDAADQAFRSAYKLRSMIVPEDKRPIKELCEQDYDDMVIYWSR